VFRQSLRRIAVAAGAVLALSAAVAVPAASADPNFGAGNLDPMEITEGGSLDYSVSFDACPQGFECQLVTYLQSGTATRGKDFQSQPGIGHWYLPQDGRMVGVQPINTVDDKDYEGDERLFMTARVDYFKQGCPQLRQANPDCWPPDHSMTWMGIVTIHDNDHKPIKVSRTRVSDAGRVGTKVKP
jgi:hypothetical protein